LVSGELHQLLYQMLVTFVRYQIIRKRNTSGLGDSETAGINDHAGVVAWACKYYETLETNGKFTIINKRLPYKITFMGMTDSTHSLIDYRLQTAVADANGYQRPKFEPFSKIFLESPSPLKKRNLDLAFFHREPFDPNRTFYMWRGIYTKPIQGDCALTLAYILDIIANKDEKLNKWILDFLAHMVQKPFEKQNYHVFKTSSANDIFGDHKAQQMLHTLVLLLEEVTFGGDVKNKGQMNDLISGHTQTINLKHGAHIVVDNIMRVIMAANPGHAIIASLDERRITAADVSSAQQQNHAYFAAIQNELDHSGYSALMFHLMNR
jgi:hypothetical protein